MKKVITYGTYDNLHFGHINLLKRAKELGDYLIVGVTSDEYDRSRGKIDVRKTLVERVDAVRATGLADEIVVEEYEGQKIDDIIKYDVDIFTVGSDWLGKFDYLNEFCEVVYLPRTPGISSTEIREVSNPLVRLGIIGSDIPVERFIHETEYVSGISVTGIYGRNEEAAQAIAKRNHVTYFDECNEKFYDCCDAVYIVDRIDRHKKLVMEALQMGKHVICEAPTFMSEEDAKECYEYAMKNNLILFDAIKTKFFPAYRHLVLLLKSGKIGEIKDIDVTFSQKLPDVDYMNINKYKGAIYALAGYIFLPILQLLGKDNLEDIQLFTHKENEFDVFTKGVVRYSNAMASFKTGQGVKSEGAMIITGTLGYVYIPAPWWKTDYFEIRYEDLRDTKKYFWNYEGEGYRYEIIEFLSRINTEDKSTVEYYNEESAIIGKILGDFESGKYVLF